MWNKVVSAPLLDIILTARSRTRAAARSLFAATFACLQLSCLMTVAQESVASPPQETPLLVGFNVGGVDWKKPELVGIKDPEAQLQKLGEIAELETSMVHQLGGNALRLFYNADLVLGSDFWQLKPDKPVFYQMPMEDRLRRLDVIDTLLQGYITRIYDPEEGSAPLDWKRMDAYLDGVARFNKTLEPSERIQVLMTLVAAPPRPIVETPSDWMLHHHGRSYRFNTLWGRYVKVQIGVIRDLVRRYIRRYPEDSDLLVAIEVVNEPDYGWIPDEMRVERSENGSASPMDKYITELNPEQIPRNDRINKSAEPSRYGYREQDIAWDEAEFDTPLIDFDWGRKFDRYVKYLSRLHEHVSFAARDEANQLGHPIKVISGAVTHNNIDYLIRMQEANPNTFKYVDGIGLHPYHWPRHDIWDTQFVSNEPLDGWRKASPREMAMAYIKRFDFIQVIADMMRQPKNASDSGFSGKSIWITEFGIPTKKLQKANMGLEELKLFIYERGEEIPSTIDSIIWEDKWDRFFEQVDRDYLVANGVEGFFFYTLREGLQSESNDDHHSNFAIFDGKGEPRMETKTLARLENFIRSLTLKEK